MPLAETVEGMQALVEEGKIRRWGVSNLDADDMEELVVAASAACVTDQILSNQGRRGPERDLLPWLTDHNMLAMVHSPVEQGRLVEDPDLTEIAASIEVTAPQLALAWVLRQPEVIAIPKAGTVAHVEENRRAADIELTAEVLARMEDAFPAPRGRVRLEMLQCGR